MDPSEVGWHEYLIAMAQTASIKSKDPQIQVGAIIVGPDHEIRSTGFNDFPRGVMDKVPSRWKKPEDNLWIEHAERNAIYNAARTGVRTDDCDLYINVHPSCICVECMRAIIQSGISRVIGPDIVFSGGILNRPKDIEVKVKMLQEAGIETIVVGVQDAGSGSRSG